MKIVHIITRLILGGAQENTLITCRELAEKGHEVTLITGPAIGPEGNLYEKTRNAGFKTVIIDELVREISPFKDIIAYLKIKNALKKARPDIVHSHSAKAGILGRYAADAMLGKFNDKNLPAIVHSIHGLAFHPYQSTLLNKLYIVIERCAAKRTDAFISVADKMTHEALQNGIGCPEQFITAYSAIDQQDYDREYCQQEIADFRRKYGISEQATVLITIARLAPLKGHEFIVESAKKLAAKYENCVWLIVGDGQLIENIKEQIKLNSLRYNFIFTGLLKPEEIPLALHSSDILVHTSLREGLARVLPQAMLCEKPVISFDIAGASEVVNEKTGILVEPGNVEALTEACQQLIENEELRRKLGKMAKTEIAEKFKPQTMIKTIEGLYCRLLACSQ